MCLYPSSNTTSNRCVLILMQIPFWANMGAKRFWTFVSVLTLRQSGVHMFCQDASDSQLPLMVSGIPVCEARDYAFLFCQDSSNCSFSSWPPCTPGSWSGLWPALVPRFNPCSPGASRPSHVFQNPSNGANSIVRDASQPQVLGSDCKKKLTSTVYSGVN